MSTKRATDILLHDYIGHTNKLQPYSVEIGYNKYPAQENDIGTTITLKYRYRQLPEHAQDDPPVHRPEDDTDYYEPKQYTEGEENNLMEEEFTILRHDKMECFEAKLIAISVDFAKILCIRLDQVTDLTTDCFIYPNQMTELIGFNVIPQYVADLQSPREAHVICATKAEPMYSVILEYIDDSKYRVLTADEVQFLIPVDDWKLITRADNFEKVWVPVENPVPYFYLNDMQIGTVRRNLMEGFRPYTGEEGGQ